MALTKLTSNLIEGGTGTDWVTAIQTSNFTAEAGKGYFVNTTSQVLYVNLPVGVVGMEITIQDYAGTFATNKVILNANGSEKIQGSALEGKINTNNATAVLIYQDAIEGWTSQDVSLNQTEISWAIPTGQSLTYSTPSPQSSQGAEAATFPTTTFTATKAGEVISGTATIAGLPSGITAAQTITGSGTGNTLTVTLTGTFPSTDSLNTNLTLSGLTLTVGLTVDYLVVAGGGGTDAFSGGGGAGGLRTSFGTSNGGGSAVEPSLALSTSGSTYTVTVGAGGTGVGYVAPGGTATGSNSVFSNITSNGGGGGSYQTGPTGGGSGGGAGCGSNPGSYSGGTRSTSPTIQGYNGGNSGPRGGGYPTGGGGGAGDVGQNYISSTQSGSGGVGLSNGITGSNVFYAGGGGGTVHTTGTPGTGGNGGGGNGGKENSSNGTSGTPNTGGGAGGSPSNASSRNNGGSGIVILRYPSNYTISIGSGLTGSTATDGSDNVTTFTAGTGSITFS